MKGVTYFSSKAFSINEGRYPNIHIRWRNGFFFYLAFSSRFKWFWGTK